MNEERKSIDKDEANAAYVLAETAAWERQARLRSAINDRQINDRTLLRMIASLIEAHALADSLREQRTWAYASLWETVKPLLHVYACDGDCEG